MTYKNTLISFMMIAALGLATWMTFFSYSPSSLKAPQTKALPDAMMEEVTAFIFDKQGKPSIKVVTPKLLHYIQDDTTTFTTPELTLYRKSPQPWYVNARSAKATQGMDNINFLENVTIHHAADQNNPATLIKTKQLMVHPHQQTAETNALITMIQPNTVVRATGMEADMNSGDIKLLSGARGEYVPNS